MKARGGKFLLILGAGLAVMAFVVVYVVMSKGVGSTASQAQNVPIVEPVKVSVVVVNRDVPAYTMLDATNVATIDVDKTTAPQGASNSTAALIGKMTLVPLTKGQLVRADQLTESGFSNILAKGERAYSLAVPERSTFGNSITENDRVDLLWSVKIKYYANVPKPDNKTEPQEEMFTSTKTLLQNVHVLRVITLQQLPPSGQNPKSGAASATSNSDSSADNAVVNYNLPSNTASNYAPDATYHTVLVLGVTDQQAEILTYARDNGEIDLTLRSSALQKDDKGNVVKDDAGKEVRGDKEVEKTTGISLDTLIEQYGLPVPKAAPGK